MVSSFLKYCQWFFDHIPRHSESADYFVTPLRINGSAIESLFSLLKYGAGGNLTALNYGSGLARVQARTEVSRKTYSGKGYRDDVVMPHPTEEHAGQPSSSSSPNAITVIGQNKPYGFSVTEFLFPFSVSQSVLGGRHGSNACTLIAISFGNRFMRSSLQKISGLMLPLQWTSAITNSIADGNTLHDIAFEGQPINLDVQDAVDNFADELQVMSYDENICNCSNQDMTPLIGLISEKASRLERKAGVLIVDGLTVAVACFGNGEVAIMDSHMHGQNGALVCISNTTSELINWYKRSFHKYNNKTMAQICAVTWLNFNFE